MKDSVKLKIDGHNLIICGKVDFTSFNLLLEVKNFIIKSKKKSKIIIDFHHVHKAKSVILAMMIEWFKIAKENDIQILFTHIPKKIKQIALMSNLNELVNLKENN